MGVVLELAAYCLGGCECVCMCVCQHVDGWTGMSDLAADMALEPKCPQNPKQHGEYEHASTAEEHALLLH